MILTPWQSVVARDRHRFRVVCVGRRAGKTTLAVEEIKGKAIYTQANIAYVAPTYAQARDIAWETLKKELRGAIADNGKAINESRLEIKVNNVKGGQSTITLRGWESIESLRGQSFDMLVIDEVAMMRNFWAMWQEVIRPALTDRKGEVIFISTPKGFNFFYELYNLENVDKDYKSFHYTSYDNPHLDHEEIKKAQQEVTDTRFAQEYLADFRKVEGLVYKEFDRTRHLYTDLPKDTHYDYLGGVDFGFNNPAAVPHIYKTGDGIYYVENEWYQKGRTEAQIADYVLSCKFNRVYPDPENPSAIQVMAARGVNVREVVKNKDSIKNGIDKIRDLFKQNKLFINKRCVNLVGELESYCYPDSIDGKNDSENPIKENDHLCFTEDTVIEPFGGEIMGKLNTGKKDVYEFMGSRVTKDHPYLTQRGFVALDSLRYSDIIVVWKNKSLMGLSLGDTQIQKSVPIGAIFHLLRKNVLAARQNAFIGIYGKSNTVRFLRVIMFTIETVILLITTYLISKFLLLRNIYTKTTVRCFQFGKSTQNQSGRLLKNGTAVTKGKNFIEKLLNCLGKLNSMIKNAVNNAVKNTRLPFQKDLNSATIIAKLRHLGKEDVYSTVSSNGVFLANGVLVSNCDALRYVIYMEYMLRRKVVEEKPRPVFNDSRYGGTIKQYADEDEITEQELSVLGHGKAPR